MIIKGIFKHLAKSETGSVMAAAFALNLILKIV